jgi:hypothetical protein
MFIFSFVAGCEEVLDGVPVRHVTNPFLVDNHGTKVMTG